MKRVTQHPLFRPLLWAAVALLLVDAFLVLAELLQRQYRHYGRFPAFAHPGWRADPDGSFAEIWGYLKAIGAGALLVYLWTRTRRASVPLATGVLFFVVALDDMLQIHEIGGGQLSIRLDLPHLFGLRGQDLGEVIIWVLLGLPLMVWIAVAYLRSGPWPRRIAHALLPAFAALLFFAVAVDMLLVMTVSWGWSGRATYLVSLTELVGELVALTAVFLVPMAYVLHLRAAGEAAARRTGTTDR